MTFTARKSLRRGSASFALFCSLGVLISAWAGAHTGYGYRTGVFGGSGSGDGQFSLNPGIGAPGAGIAVDEVAAPHEIYVVDTLNNRVEKFSETGAFVAAWGWGVSNGEERFEVCTSGCEKGLPGPEEGQFSQPVSVAVDNSTDASSGDVYVADSGVAESGNPQPRIEKFSPSGTLLGHFGAAADSGSADDPLHGLGGLEGGNSIFVDAHGDVWVADASNKRVVEYSSSGEYLAEINNSLISESAFGLTVNVGGDVYVVNGAANVREFGPAPSFPFIRTLDGSHSLGAKGRPQAVVTNSANEGSEAFVGNGTPPEFSIPYQIFQFASSNNEALPTDSFGASFESLGGSAGIGESTGIALDLTNGKIYVADEHNNDVDVFGLVELPDVTTGVSSNVKGTTGTVAGTADAVGLAGTHYFFEYGTSISYGLKSNEEAISGSTSQPVTTELAGLEPLTTYHYRLVAVNANGTSRGPDAEFTTGPLIAGVVTGEPADVSINTATLNASLDPEGIETHYFFEYSKTPLNGEFFSNENLVDFGEGSSAMEEQVEFPIESLQEGTTYHYRIVTYHELSFPVNPLTFTAGKEVSFTTLPALPVVDNKSPSFATEVSLHEATLHGTVNPGRGITTYHFKYGPCNGNEASRCPESLYPSKTLEAYTQLNDSDDTVEQLITGLNAGTNYHYALVATNASGSITGEEGIFSASTSSTPLEEVVGEHEAPVTIGPIIQPSTLALLPTPNFNVIEPIKYPPVTIKCKRDFVKKHDKCVRKKPAKKKTKKHQK